MNGMVEQHCQKIWIPISKYPFTMSLIGPILSIRCYFRNKRYLSDETYIPKRHQINQTMNTKVVLVTMNLGVGGAERVLVNLANAWAKEEDKEVSIICIGNLASFYPIDKNVTVYRLDLVKSAYSVFESLKDNYNRAVGIRKIIKQVTPDVIISFMTTTNVLAVWATLLLPVKLILADRAVLSLTDGQFWQTCAKIFYRFSDILVVQTQGVTRHYKYFGVNLKVINNALVLPQNITDKSPLQQKKTILMVGRLEGFKKMEWGLEAFQQVQDIAADWTLQIVGDGPQRAFLENWVAKLGLKDKVVFLGTKNNVFDYLKFADIFLMTSSTEGYPNVLAEAMVMGLPCLSTDCPYGPSEMIESGVNGTIVPMKDIAAIAAGLRSYMLDETKRTQHGLAAKALSKSIDLEYIADKWAALFPAKVRNKNSDKSAVNPSIS